MIALKFDPYGACARCDHMGRDAQQHRVCQHPELKARPVEEARSKFGGCGPEATRALGEWTRLQ